MMKKYTGISTLLCYLLFLINSLSGQTIVSTAIEEKSVVLEEFGGIFCVYCPDGHQISATLQNQYPDKLVLLNYQTGYYAVPISGEPNLQSPYGATVADLSGLNGYPAGMVNRHVFEGYEQSIPGTFAMSRSNWGAAISETIGETALVNIATEASLNMITRELVVEVEYYYTADVNAINNRLHVAVLQNNILGPQLGGGQGNYYAHNHVVRDFLTGQWGHIITNTSEGTFGSLTYEVVLPESYNLVALDPVNVELAVFITDETEEILNSTKTNPTLESIYTTDANVLAILGPDEICPETGVLSTSIRVRNDGSENLQSAVIRYNIVGFDVQEIIWEGDLIFLEETDVTLPDCSPDWNNSPNIFNVEVVMPNAVEDQNTGNNTQQLPVDIGPYSHLNTMEIVIRTDDFGYETYWEIVDDFGQIYASGGNEVVGATVGGAQIAAPSDPGAYPSDTYIIEEITLPYSKCYTLRVLDDFADGLCCSYGNGFFRLLPVDESPIIMGGDFGAVDERKFFVDAMSTSNPNEIEASNDKPLLFPNPVIRGQNIQLTNSQTTNIQWQVLNSHGQLILQGNEVSIPSSALLPGFYTVRCFNEKQSWVLPLVVQ